MAQPANGSDPVRTGTPRRTSGRCSTRAGGLPTRYRVSGKSHPPRTEPLFIPSNPPEPAPARRQLVPPRTQGDAVPRRGFATSLPGGGGPAALGPRPVAVSQEGPDRCGGSRFQLSALRRPLDATGATVVDGLGLERTLTALHQHGHLQFFDSGCRAESVQSRPVGGTAEPVLICQIAANHTSLRNSSKKQIRFVSSVFILCLRRFPIVSNSCLPSQRL
jgi:hypothetical protein